VSEAVKIPDYVVTMVTLAALTAAKGVLEALIPMEREMHWTAMSGAAHTAFLEDAQANPMHVATARILLREFITHSGDLKAAHECICKTIASRDAQNDANVH